MENLTRKEIEILEQGKLLFNVKTLTKPQMELLLKRTIIEPSEVPQKQNPKEKAVKGDFYIRKLFEDEDKKATRKIKRESDVIFHIPNIFRTSVEKPYIEKIHEYRNEKYNTDSSEWKIYGHVDFYQVNNIIKDLIERMTVNLPDNVKLQVILDNTAEHKITQTQLLRKNEIVDKLSEWVQLFMDYQDMDIENVTFKLLAIELPKGAGRVNKLITPQGKKSIISITNVDSMCLARAIVVALAVNNKDKFLQIFMNKLTNEQLKEINKGRQLKKEGNGTQINDGKLSGNEIKYIKDGQKLQDILANALHSLCDVVIKPLGNDFADAKLFEEKLDISIHIYNSEARQIYNCSNKPVIVNLFWNNNHYDVISKLPAFLGTNASHHKAENAKCKACKNATKCDISQASVTCTACHKYFYGESCWNNHITNKKCIEHSYRCEKCHKFYKTADLKLTDHKCDEVKCGNCKKYVPMNHECYMLQQKIKESSVNYIFYDFETKLDPTTKKHIVNYCVAQYFNGEEKVFTTLDGFCEWAFVTEKTKHKGYTFIAHYGKGYDFQFVAEWLIAHAVKPNIIYNGQKILQLEVKRDYNMRFIDSISFTLMPLKNFPKTFGLTELAKGYFPHKFNTDENQDYIGCYPDKEFYGYSQMTKKNREDFDEWYQKVKDETFNFQEEMKKYCRSDVDILRRGCLELRRLFLEITGIDPFQYITIASVCQAYYRSSCMPENQIAIYSENPTDNYSIKSIKWLKYIAQKEKINIQHACNGGEASIKIHGKTYKVDGYCEQTRTIYQFHGCYFHGCLTCYNELTVNKVSGYNMKYLYNRTMDIDSFLRKSGYKVITIWEHEFDKDKNLKDVTLEEFDLVEPPKLRDAFYGGRCEPVKLIYDFKSKNEQGKYIDVVSLYPTVMYYDKYPVGHPTRIVKPVGYDENWFGFIYCKVLPPRGLYLPVLPYKQKTKQAPKLMFGLCRTCMDRLSLKCKHKCKEKCPTCYEERNSDCKHSDVDRAITGFWTTTEIKKST